MKPKIRNEANAPRIENATIPTPTLSALTAADWARNVQTLPATQPPIAPPHVATRIGQPSCRRCVRREGRVDGR